MARSKTTSAQSEANETEGQEIHSSFLDTRAPRKPIDPSNGRTKALVVDSCATGPGTVGGMKTYGVVYL